MDNDITNLDTLLSDMETDAWGEHFRERFHAASRELAPSGRRQSPWQDYHGGPAHPFQAVQAFVRAPKLLTARPLVFAAVSLVVAIGIILAALLGSLWRMRPQTVSAQEIIQRAQTVLASPAISGVDSFSLVADTEPVGVVMQTSSQARAYSVNIHDEIKDWYQSPDQWRFEANIPWPSSFLNGSGPVVTTPSVSVSDGSNVWSYTQLPAMAGTVPPQIAYVHRRDPKEHAPVPIAQLAHGAGDVNNLLAQISACRTATLAGSDTVAGRPVYVVDLGTSKCGSDPKELSGRRVIWVDKQTYFVLKNVQYSGVDGSVFSAMEVKSIQYNVALDSSLFTFTAPPGVKVESGPPGAVPRSGGSSPQPTPAG